MSTETGYAIVIQVGDDAPERSELSMLDVQVLAAKAAAGDVTADDYIAAEDSGEAQDGTVSFGYIEYPEDGEPVTVAGITYTPRQVAALLAASVPIVLKEGLSSLTEEAATEGE